MGHHLDLLHVDALEDFVQLGLGLRDVDIHLVLVEVELLQLLEMKLTRVLRVHEVLLKLFNRFLLLIHLLNQSLLLLVDFLLLGRQKLHILVYRSFLPHELLSLSSQALNVRRVVPALQYVQLRLKLLDLDLVLAIAPLVQELLDLVDVVRVGDPRRGEKLFKKLTLIDHQLFVFSLDCFCSLCVLHQNNLQLSTYLLRAVLQLLQNLLLA